MTKITHSVILSVLPGSAHSELLEQFCSKITSSMGNKNYLLHFWCSEIDASHPVYLEIVAHMPKTVEDLDDAGPGLSTRIPHQLVLMISDPPLDRKQFGF